MFDKTIGKFKFKFEPKSRGSLLSSQGRCVTNKASILIMVLNPTLKKEPKKSSTGKYILTDNRIYIYIYIYIYITH